MGRFYKTSAPESIDFLYEQPKELMLKAVQLNDAAIDSQYQQAALLKDKLLQIKYLEKDKDRVQKYIDEYQSKTDEITKTLQNNPLEWRKQMPYIKDLGRTLDNDFNRGEIASIQSNYNTFQKWDEAQKTRLNQPVDKGGITVEQYQKAKAKFLSRFDEQGGTNYNPNTRSGNSIYTEDLATAPDINGDLQKWMKDFQSNGWERGFRQVNVGGKYITESGYKKGNEFRSEDEVYNAGLNFLMADPRYTGYFKQGNDMGYLKGVYNSDGTLINPIKGRDAQGRLVFNPESYLAKPLEAAVMREAFSKTKEENFQEYKGADPFMLDDRQSANRMKELHEKDMIDNPLKPLVITETPQKMFPDKHALKGMYDIISEYEKLAPSDRTADATVRYQNAQRNVLHIQEQTMKELNIDEKTYKKMLPALMLIHESGREDPDDVAVDEYLKADSETNKLYQEKMATIEAREKQWKDAYKGGNGTVDYRSYASAMEQIKAAKDALFFGVEKTKKDAFAVANKYADKKKETAKIFTDNNISYKKGVYVNPDPKDRTGNVQRDVANALSVQTGFNAYSEKGSPIKLQMNGKALGTVNQISKYLTLSTITNENENGQPVTGLVYTIDFEKMKNDKVSLKDAYGNPYRDNVITFNYKNISNVKEAIKSSAQRNNIPTAAVNKYFSVAEDGFAADIINQLSKRPYQYDYKTGQLDPVSLMQPYSVKLGDVGYAIVSLVQDKDGDYKNEIKVKDYKGVVHNLEEYAQEYSDGSFSIEDQTTLATALTEVATVLSDVRAKELHKKNSYKKGK